MQQVAAQFWHQHICTMCCPQLDQEEGIDLQGWWVPGEQSWLVHNLERQLEKRWFPQFSWVAEHLDDSWLGTFHYWFASLEDARDAVCSQPLSYCANWYFTAAQTRNVHLSFHNLFIFLRSYDLELLNTTLTGVIQIHI